MADKLATSWAKAVEVEVQLELKRLVKRIKALEKVITELKKCRE